MQVYEYKVIPAPRRGEKERGARSVPERFGVALTQTMNRMARDGWEYLRADTLPCDERVGLTGTATHFQNMLVFRRSLAPVPHVPLATPVAASVPPPPPPPSPRPEPAPSAADLLPEAQPEATVLASLSARAPEGAAPSPGPAKSPFTQAPNGRL